MASNPAQIEHILSLDFSDPCNEDYVIFGPNSRIIIDYNDCVVEATNAAAKLTKGDILIYLSDDFLCPKGWDTKVIERFGVNIRPSLLKVHDGLQDFNKDVLTIPIMNRLLYQELNYFWNPIYRSMFVDQDLYHVCNNNAWINYAQDLIFQHEHYSIGKAPRDATYIRSDENWVTGQMIYMKRKMEGFKI